MIDYDLHESSVLHDSGEQFQIWHFFIYCVETQKEEHWWPLAINTVLKYIVL
jgi:hypothetical protein